MKVKNIVIPILSIALLVISGCLEMEVVNQPLNVPMGTSFDAEIMVEFRKDGGIGDDDDRAMLFAVMKPEAWSIDSIRYSSPQHGDGTFNFLGNTVDEDEEGGIEEGWQDSLEQDYPSPTGMHWQMYVSDRDTTSSSSEDNPDIFHVTVSYTVDNTLATYSLSYYTTHTNNNDHTDQSKADMDQASTSVFDPSVPVSVTLQVDMSNQTVSANGVHVAGSFQGWDPGGTALSDADGDSIYSVTLDMTGISDPVLYYKFINGNSWGNDETVSDQACGGAGGFQSDRFLNRPIADVTLDPVCFSECIGCDESYVTFQLDMSETTVAENGIYLGGGIWHNNYIEMEQHGLIANTDFYMLRVTLPEDSSFYYKFNNGGNDAGYESGDNLTLEGCGASGNWGDRSITVSADNAMLPPVCFSSCYECGNAPVTASVTFQADMTTLISQGWDNTTNTMELRGGINGWAAGDVFQEDLTDPTLYSITKSITAQVGTEQEWKFKANPDANFNNNGWETAANRMFYFWGDDIVLEPEQPAILPIGDLTNDVTVEIQATWMEGTLNVNSGEPFPQAPDTIIINGSFLNCWCTWGNCMGATCADPVSADVPRLVDPDGDGVYVGSLSLTAGHGNVFTYKLGAYYPGVEDVAGDNGAMDNEAGFGADKTYYIPTDASGTVVLETVFGDNNPENPFLTRTITLNLDMNDEVVSEDGVHVAGSFQGWDPAATELLDPDHDGIYSVNIEADAGDTIYFKYINGNAWGSDEGVSDPICGGAGGFGSDRWLEIPNVNTSLDPVCFSECIACDESYVTFHVDMAEVETISADGAFLGGGIWHNNYQSMNLVEDSLYMIKVTLPEDSSFYYKFNNGGNDQGYESGDDLSAGGCGDPDNWGDRSITVSADDAMLPPVCFSSCYECGNAPVTASVTFQADMTTLISQGWDNTTNTMELRGGINGWAAGDVFQEDLTDPTLYSITKSITAQVGTEQEWKFKANPDDDFNNSGWETAANRMFEFTGEDMILEAAQPVILPIGDLENDVTVEIHATWMEGTLNVNSGEPFPQAPDTIIINGSFLNCWCTWGNCMGATCVDPVSADVPRLVDPDGDGVYVGSLSLPAGHGNVFTYKLGAYYPGVEDVAGDNGAMDNEAGFGADKTYFIATDASGTVALETVFGDNNPENPWIGVVSIDLDADLPAEFKLLGNYPNPFNPVTKLRFDIDYRSNVIVTIYNILGNEITTLQNGEMNPGRYSMIWNATNDQGERMPTGMYLYKVSSDSRVLTGKMLLMK